MTHEIQLAPGPSDRAEAGAPPAASPPAASAPAASAPELGAASRQRAVAEETTADTKETTVEQETEGRQEAQAGQETISARVQKLTEAVGPTTLATALLIWFGYLATRARFDYFGISLDMTGLSNQSLLLYGLEVVYVPAALICLGALLFIGVHAVVSWRLTRRPGDVTNTFMAAGLALVGVILIARALIGMFLQDPTTSVVFDTTQLALAFGPAAAAYGVHVHGKNRGRPLMSPRLARYGVLCVLGLAVAGLFWAATTLAWLYGTGRGEQDARELPKRAEVILDVKEPLRDIPSGITHIPLSTTGKDPSFAHRYRGFRVLLASGGRLFLVGSGWKLGRDQTIVVPYDSSIRIQLLSQP